MELWWFLIPLAIWVIVQVQKKPEPSKPLTTSLKNSPAPPPPKQQDQDKTLQQKKEELIETVNEVPKMPKRSRLARMILSKEILERRE